ncbi:MAG: HAMP domain-containing protein [Candidatus Lambdaproteobacteria bacterium]|nr:HAMP domain-containing protein [Candidatus Lambdaproteobacteria bacterium]
MPRLLIVKFYLWFLLALTLTIVAAAAVVSLLEDHRWGERMHAWATAEVTLLRDHVQTLWDAGMPTPQVRARLEPLLAELNVSLAIVDESGRALLVLRPPGAPPESGVMPGLAQRQRIAAEGRLQEFHLRRNMAAGLPIRLQDGQRGVLYVQMHRPGWARRGPPLPLLAGLAMVLLVGLVLSWPLARHLTRPMRSMAATADALGRGDLSARIRLRRRDELGQLAASLNRMAENLQQLVEGHKRLLADISHELRSPLARLQVALALAQAELPGAKAGEVDTSGGEPGTATAGYLRRATRQAEEIDALIGELLTYSRLELAPYTLQPQPVALQTLVQEALEPLAPELAARRVDVTQRWPEPPLTISGDRTLLGRALANVLRNALAHAPAQSHITVQGRAVAEGVELSIADEGPGVAAGQREAIFRPFVRTDAARQRDTGGVGLGLAIVRRAVEAHGGRVWAEQGEQGRGLRIRISLPARPGAAPAAGAAE